jgi:hypothetical protein
LRNPKRAQLLPLRWYDDSVPYHFPECHQSVNNMDGKHHQYVTPPRRGDFYNLSDKGRGGRLVWLNAQTENRPAHYEIRDCVVSEHASRSAAEQAAVARPLRGFIGDGLLDLVVSAS